MEYLTPDDFKKAEQNGIPEERVKQRFYSQHWSKERAITQPYKPLENKWDKYKDRCVVKRNTFYQRVGAGWTEEEAASTPPLPNGVTYNSQRMIPEDIKDLAEKNGIKYGTLYHRIHTYKWSPEDAATIPVGTKRPNRRKKGWSHSYRRM
jgi:hypothetical protein